MPKDRWTMVRLDRSTHAELLAVRQSMLEAAEQGKIALDLDHTGGVSLNQVVSYLVRHYRGHHERVRKSKAAARTNRDRDAIL